MFKLINLLFILFVFINTTKAQKNSFRLRLGVPISFGTDPLLNEEKGYFAPQATLFGGVSYSFNINDNSFLQTEASIFNRSYRIVQYDLLHDGLSGDVSVTSTIFSTSLGISYHYLFAKKFNLSGGVILSRNKTYEITGEERIGSVSGDTVNFYLTGDSEFKEVWMPEFIIGLGYNLNRFEIDLNYQRGLLKTGKTKIYLETEKFGDRRNSTLEVNPYIYHVMLSLYYKI